MTLALDNASTPPSAARTLQHTNQRFLLFQTDLAYYAVQVRRDAQADTYAQQYALTLARESDPSVVDLRLPETEVVTPCARQFRMFHGP